MKEGREWRSVLDTFVNIVPKFDDNRKRIRTMSTYTYLNKTKIKRSSKKSPKRKGIPRGRKPNNSKNTNSTNVDILQKMPKIYKYVDWFPNSNILKFRNMSRSYGKPASGDNSSIAVCSNSSFNTTTLRRLNYSCKNMFDAKAYVHWYSRYGIEGEDFQIAIDKIEKLVQAYTEMCV